MYKKLLKSLGKVVRGGTCLGVHLAACEHFGMYGTRSCIVHVVGFWGGPKFEVNVHRLNPSEGNVKGRVSGKKKKSEVHLHGIVKGEGLRKSGPKRDLDLCQGFICVWKCEVQGF